MAATKHKHVSGMTIEDRFLRLTEKQDNGCWTWTSVKASDGRGLFRVNGKWMKAHRAAKFIELGINPPDMEAHHTCVNAWCVNPDHIQYLTPAEHRAEHARLRNINGKRED